MVGTLTILPTWILYFDKAYCFVAPFFAFCSQRMVRYNHHPILSTMFASKLNFVKLFSSHLHRRFHCLLISAFQFVKEHAIFSLIANKNKLALTCFDLLSNLGGGKRDRTDDPLLAKQVLYQLSYAPSILFVLSQSLVGLVGLEPTTPRLSSVCSNRLSYKPSGQMDFYL